MMWEEDEKTVQFIIENYLKGEPIHQSLDYWVKHYILMISLGELDQLLSEFKKDGMFNRAGECWKKDDGVWRC